MARPKRRGKLKALNINIDETIADKLSDATKSTRIPKTAIVENALLEYFDRHDTEMKNLSNRK